MNIVFSENLISQCARASNIVAFTGAGISAESGVPTFRGNEGIWTKFKPEELANLDAFLGNPELVWEWYAARKKVMAEVHPNAGHTALVDMEKFSSSFSIVTQNIDNLHRRAGSKTVFELHGNIERNYCIDCKTPYSNAFVLKGKAIPRCICGGLIRPDVVWFGEVLPEEEWYKSMMACEKADVLFSIGTSGVVHPAALLPFEAKRNGALIVEINPEPTSLTEYADEFLQGNAGEVLPALVAQIRASSFQETSSLKREA